MIKKINTSLVKVVNILSDGEYHDGTSLGEALNMTRSAIWKTIKKLQNYHIKIDSVKGKGYALLEPLSLLDSAKIKKKLHGEKCDISLFESIDSTNAYLKSYRNNKGTKICLAEQQTQGRGRLNRDWHSPFGQNIYMSCLYSLQKDISELAGLSLVTALSIVKTLKEFGMDDQLLVKWPNDILYDGKKIAGGLIEVHAEAHGLSVVIIGIGINVNMMEDEQQVSQPWISMRKALNHYVDRNDLCALLINNLFNYLQRFNEHGFAAFISEWMAHDCLMQKVVTLKNLNEKVTGKVVGVNDHGYLLLKLADGKVRAISSGDASIVKK